jgi:UDP-N-acetylmuramoyl-tripeptide--D-alanyl-D-alanine ligase
MAALASALPDGTVAGHFTSAGDAEPVVRDALAYGDAVMIKGSNGIGLGRLVASIRNSFDKR